MLSMAPVGSAGGAANYFAADNYYTLEEAAEESIWFGEGAELLGLAPGDGEGAEAEQTAQGTGQVTGEPETGPGETIDEAAAGEARDPESEADAATDAAPEALPDDADKDPNLPGGAAIEGDPDIPFDPERPGGFPEGVSAPAPVSGPRPGKLPLTNPSGKVDARTFENILNGKLPDGTQVGDPNKRALGMDLTFSMPKSASLLALVGGGNRITEAHLASVKSTMRWVEANLAEGRKKIDGRDVPVRTGNLVYALFQHDTSRALDPQSHIHAVIANMTRMPDGSWRALHNGEIWRNNTVISSIYHAAFRGALEKLGYTVQLQGKHGTFEIAGVSKTVREAFSQRREAILAKAAELGTASLQGLREVTKRSRSAKLEIGDRDALKTEWKERAAALNFDPERLVDQARARLHNEPGLLQRGYEAAEQAMAGTRAFVLDVLQKPSDPLVDGGIRKVFLTGPEARTQLATASAVRILSQREAAFEVHQLTKSALDLGLADVTPDLIASRVTQLMERGQIVPGDSKRADNVVTIVTTKEALATETGILAQIAHGKGAVMPLVRPERAVEVLAGAAGERELNDGQMAAASAIVSSSDRIVAVQGLAGAGKSTMLAAVANVLAFEKKPALGLAFQNKMVADLATGTGLETMTIASFLMEHEALIKEPGSAKASASREALGGSYLIVDEASMVSNDQLLVLTMIANRAGVDRLVLVGDRQQLLSIDAGKSFALSQAGGIAVARMDENLRQRTPELRAVAALANQGKAGAALKMLGARVTETTDRIGEAAAQWLNLSDDERETTMVFTSGRETRAGLNEEIQRGLKDEGKLTGEGLSLTVAERVDRSREELRYAHNYEPGLRLEVWTRLQSVGLERGEYRIARVFGNGKVELERHGKRTTFEPQKLASGVKLDKLNLTATKQIEIHQGDRIRWTANDKPRGLLNSALGRVVGIDGTGVMIERADRTVVRLAMGDPMLARLDLAYALNMHMAQGITTDKGIVVMGSEERFLSNQRLFNVAVTRVRDAVSVVTDSIEKLGRQLDRTSGDKYSALEAAGRLDIDRHKTPERDTGKPFDPESLDGIGGKDKSTWPGPGPGPAPRNDAKQPAAQLPVPEKIKGMEL